MTEAAAPAEHEPSAPVTLGLLLMDGLCLGALSSLCSLLRKHVELAHPVFAVLFQCVLVQLLSQVWALTSLLLGVWLLGIVEFGNWLEAVSLVSVAIRQFYEVSWACVTYLR